MSIFVTTFEIDLPRCSLTYGGSPCSAAVGVTGERKCFQSPWTCQDLNSFSPQVQTVRFTVATEGLHQAEDTEALPFLKRVRVDPQRIKAGEDLGKRERVTITLQNGRYGDTIFDKYLEERDYIAYERGTWAGRFVARYRNIKGYPCRIVRGYSDTPYAERERTHYIAHIAELSSDSSNLVIEAKDPLDVVEGKKYLFPRPNSGTLDRDIQKNSGLSFDLTPPGVGSEYPTNFEGSIGDENVSCSRSGDTITLTGRGLYGSEVQDHEEGDTLQETGHLQGTVSDILYELLNQTGLDQDWLVKSDWDEEISAANLTRNYSGKVGEPTEIWKLIGELMRDAGLSILSDLKAKQIVLQVIRNLPASFHLPQGVLMNSEPLLNASQRLSSVYVQYGRKNPLEKMNEDKNYVGHLFRVDPNPIYAATGNLPEIRKIQSRFIGRTARPAADELTLILLSRYRNVLRGARVSVDKDRSPRLGQVGTVALRHFEDDTGSIETPLKVQVVEVEPMKGRNRLTLEEFNIDETIAPDPNIRRISIVDDMHNLNFRDYYNEAYSDAPPENSTIEFRAIEGVVIGSDIYDVDVFAAVIGSWPASVTIRLVNVVILGRGGNGGGGGFEGLPGQPGLKTTRPVECVNCVLAGGGGGGGGDTQWGQLGNVYHAEGGGGAGRRPGIGYENGTDYTGGAGQNTAWQAIAGAGGDIGQPGSSSEKQNNPGGAAGVAVDGYSYLTLQNTTIYGLTEN